MVKQGYRLGTSVRSEYESKKSHLPTFTFAAEALPSSFQQTTYQTQTLYSMDGTVLEPFWLGYDVILLEIDRKFVITAQCLEKFLRDPDWIYLWRMIPKDKRGGNCLPSKLRDLKWRFLLWVISFFRIYLDVSSRIRNDRNLNTPTYFSVERVYCK